jgi:hypothetical protein
MKLQAGHRPAVHETIHILGPLAFTPTNRVEMNATNRY